MVELEIATIRELLREWVDTQHPDGNLGPGREQLAKITESLHRLAEQITQLRSSQERYRVLSEATRDALFIIDAGSEVIIDANDRAAELVGCPKTDLVGRLFSVLHPGEELTERRAAFSRCLAGEASEPEVATVRSNDGRRIPVKVGFHLFSVGGRAMVQAVYHNISAQIETEEAMRIQSVALETASSGIVITDRDGVILWVNGAFCRLTGYEAEELLGRNLRMLRSPQRSLDHFNALWTAIRRGRVWRGEAICQRRDGSLYVQDQTFTPVRDRHGEVSYFVGIQNDITHQKQLEDQIRQAQRIESLGTLAGGVAHDFNNLLMVLLGHLEFLSAEPNLSLSAMDSMREMTTALERATGLTRQLLAFSRKQPAQLRKLNLNDAVANFAKMLRRLIREDIQLQIHTTPEPVWIEADIGMIEQVLMNLSLNARDAMPQGGDLTVQVDEIEVDEAHREREADARPGRFARVTVSDSGIGIPPEILPRIFDPFFTTKESGRGTGLGLATVHGIVQQHQGWIEVSSQPAHGSTFRVLLPLLQSGTASEDETGGKPVPRGGTETILLAEDEGALRLLARQVLEYYGYRIIEADSGQAALEAWEKANGEIDLLLTDMVMPFGMTGRQLAERLRKLKPGLRVIITSGYGPELTGRDALIREGYAFLQKPYPPAELAQAVRETLDLKPTHPPSTPGRP